MKKKIVLIPTPAKGHLVSTLQFANHLLNHTCHDAQLSITIISIPPYAATTATTTLLDTKNDHTDTRIQFINLPNSSTPISPDIPSIERLIDTYISNYKQLVKDAITNVISSDRGVQLVGLVVDMFCTSMIDVANEFNVPSYLFITSGAAFLGFLHYLQHRFDQVGTHVLDSLETELSIPCYANPVPVNSLPSFAVNKDGHDAFVAQARRFKETKGIFINTFVELEPHTVKYLASLNSDGKSDGYPTIYTVGPVVDLTSLDDTLSVEDDRSSKIFKWLDSQPPSSVVLLCFGSMGFFNNRLQIEEIALGLERSGQRFLWSVRQPPLEGEFTSPGDYDSYEEILPPGYLDRIGNRGMLCGWIPQVRVLAHPSIGGFVSHCGWNSILESIWFGVPIVTWPLYAEQKINAFQLVKDLGLAIELTLDYTNDGAKVLPAYEIERAVTGVMEKDSESRKRVTEMCESSRKAISAGGTSFVSYGRLLNHMLRTGTK